MLPGPQMVWRWMVAAVIMSCVLSTPSVRCDAGAAAKERGKAGGAPCVSCVRVEQPPTIDGVLDDACWQQAARCEGFYRTDKDLPATEPTEAFVCQDDEHLYVAFRCHDSEPEKIKREQRKRGGQLWLDDVVEVDLDTYHQHQNGYWFTVNARGTQNEYMLGGNVPKIEWRGDWRAAAQVNADGWTAEMAIPFTILRYPTGGTTWGICLWRRLARAQEWSCSPRMGETWNWEKCADLAGLTLPPYREATVLLPYALAESGGENANGLDLGLDVKRPLRGGLRLYGTYNPDFRNIEDVVESIDFTYTERYLPERRPFFIEAYGDGSNIVLYTRRITDVSGGLAVTGQMGRHQAGLLFVNAFDQGNIFALQHGYSLAPASEISWAVAGQHGAESPDHVTIATGLDLGRNTDVGTDSIGLRYYTSRSAGAGGDGAIWRVSASSWRGQGRVSFSGSYGEVAEDFNDTLAFVPEKGVRTFSVGADAWSRLETGRIRSTSWWSSFSGADSLVGDSSYYFVSIGGKREFRNDRSQSIGAHYGRRERFTDAGVSLSHGWNVNDLYRSGSAYAEVGRRLGGSSLYVSARQGLKLGERLALEARAEYLRMTSPVEPEEGRQVVVTGTYDLSDERTISTRAVKRAEGFNVYFTYRQVVRRGMDAYVIVGDPNADTFERRIAIKTVWALFP